MKAMKQLLIVIGLMSMLSLNAQNIYAMPAAQMSSTSAMVGSGSSLPQAAINGTQTTYDSKVFYGSKDPSRGPKKAAADGDTPPADPNGPMEDPLGDAVLPLLLLAAGYVVFVTRKRRAQNGAARN